MTAPNLMELTSCVADTASVNLTTSEQVIIPDPKSGDVTVPAGHVYQVEAVYVANKHATTQGSVTLKHYKDGSPVTVVILANNTPISIRTMKNLLGGKVLYVGEGDYVTIKAGANSILDADAPYADMTDL